MLRRRFITIDAFVNVLMCPDGTIIVIWIAGQIDRFHFRRLSFHLRYSDRPITDNPRHRQLELYRIDFVGRQK